MNIFTTFLFCIAIGTTFGAAIVKAVHARTFKNDVNLWDKYATECLIWFSTCIVLFVWRWIM